MSEIPVTVLTLPSGSRSSGPPSCHLFADCSAIRGREVTSTDSTWELFRGMPAACGHCLSRWSREQLAARGSV